MGSSGKETSREAKKNVEKDSAARPRASAMANPQEKLTEGTGRQSRQEVQKGLEMLETGEEMTLS